jgi:hypothetical protein
MSALFFPSKIEDSVAFVSLLSGITLGEYINTSVLFLTACLAFETASRRCLPAFETATQLVGAGIPLVAVMCVDVEPINS